MIVTVNVCSVLLPQLLFALIEISPPEIPVVVVIVLVEEEPDHPGGRVHV